jgi:hypothetical protein
MRLATLRCYEFYTLSGRYEVIQLSRQQMVQKEK